MIHVIQPDLGEVGLLRDLMFEYLKPVECHDVCCRNNDLFLFHHKGLGKDTQPIVESLTMSIYAYS